LSLGTYTGRIKEYVTIWWQHTKLQFWDLKSSIYSFSLLSQQLSNDQKC